MSNDDFMRILRSEGAVHPDDWKLPKTGRGLKSFVFGGTGLYALIAAPILFFAIFGILGFLLVV